MSREKNKTVLVVEDEAIICIITVKLLRKFGYNVLSVPSGEKAIELLDSGSRVDLILMDIELGTGMDGTEAAQKILQNCELPIVFHTSHSEREMVERVRGITRYGYVIKSSGDFVLQSSIEMAFDLFEAHRKVKLSEKYFHDMFESAPLAYQLLDENGIILEVNRKWTDILGYGRDEVIGRWFGELLSSGSVNDFHSFFPDLISRGEIRSEHPLIDKNGELRYISLTGTVEPGAEDSSPRVHCILADVTGQRIAESEREKALAALSEREKFIKAVMDHLPVGVAVHSAEPGKDFTYMNDNFPRFYRVSREKLRDTDSFWEEVFEDPDFRDDFRKRVTADIARGDPEMMRWERIPVTRKGEETTYITAANVMLDDSGLIISIVWDVTEARNADETIRLKNIELTELNKRLNSTVSELEESNRNLTSAVRELEVSNMELSVANRCIIENEVRIEQSEGRFHRMFEQHHAVMLLVDPETGVIIDANASACVFYGYRKEDITGMNISEINMLPGDELYLARRNIREEKRSYYVFPHRLADGTVRTVEVYSSPVTVGNRVLLFSIIHDITLRKKAEDEVMRSREEIRRIIDNSSELICEMDAEGIFTFVSPRFEQVLGYTPEELIGTRAVEKLHIDDREEALRRLEELKSSIDFSLDEFRIWHKNGSCRYFELRSSAYEDGDGEFKVVVFSHDITESRQIDDTQIFLALGGSLLEKDFFKSLARYLAKTLPADVICIDRVSLNKKTAKTVALFSDGRFLDNFEYELAGTPCGEAVGKPSCVYTRDVRKFFPDDAMLTEFGAEGYIGVTLWDSEGEAAGLIAAVTRGEMVNVHQIEAVLKMVAIRASGEIERRDAEERIISLLEEKELLLKEVHHRIKNNMSSIKGLLMLQGASAADEKVEEALNEAVSRVESMMVLYDRLFLSENMNEVNVRVYFESLVSEITDNFPNSGDVTYNLEVEDFMLNAKILAPLGIILNEIITNIMKHAFDGRDNGVFSISAALREGLVTLVVKDNGVGLPEVIELNTPGGFGMQLVRMLTEQLNGVMEIENRDGTEFRLEFSLQ